MPRKAEFMKKILILIGLLLCAGSTALDFEDLVQEMDCPFPLRANLECFCVAHKLHGVWMKKDGNLIPYPKHIKPSLRIEHAGKQRFVKITWQGGSLWESKSATGPWECIDFNVADENGVFYWNRLAFVLDKDDYEWPENCVLYPNQVFFKLVPFETSH